jgi:dipeptidase E
MNMLLFSNSKLPGYKYLEWTNRYINEFVRERSVRKILFIPFAGVSRDYEDYETLVKNSYEFLEAEIKSLHHYASLKSVIDKYDMILVGGGNTYNLLQTLQDRGDLEVIREEILRGKAYAGWSAGSIIAGPHIHTTNDMPITWPTSAKALGLFESPLNPHYTDQTLEGHMGETRDVRLHEYLVLNPKEEVIGLSEGCFLHVKGNSVLHVGHEGRRSYKLSLNKSHVLQKEAILDKQELAAGSILLS